MLHSNYFIVALIAGAITTSAAAQQSAELKWKFEKGKTFYQQVTTRTEQTMRVMGLDVAQSQEQTLYFSWTPRQRDAVGNWVFTLKLDGVRIKIDSGGNPINYDSTKDANADTPLAEFFKLIVGSEFAVALGPDYKVTGIKGKDAFLKNLIQAYPSMEGILKRMLDDEAIKQMVGLAFTAVPNRTVRKGESWKRIGTLASEQASWEVTYQYTFVAQETGESGLVTMRLDGATLKFFPPRPRAGGGGLPLVIRDADLKVKDAYGNMVFNIKKGQLVRSDTRLKMAGELKVAIGGQVTDVHLEMTHDTSVRHRDVNPLLPPKSSR